QQSAQHHANRAADYRQKQNLREVYRENARAAGTKRFHSGDCLKPSVKVTFDGITDTDTANQKRGQANDSEKLRKALDVPLELRGGIAAAADVPTGLG